MFKIISFDVLVVYSENLAQSASSLSPTPFAQNSPNSAYNQVYGYLLDSCQARGLSIAFTTSADVVEAGTCARYWTFCNNLWSKVESPCFSRQIFDKFSPTTSKIKESRKLLFSSPLVTPWNNHLLFATFFDKLNTYTRLADYSIPTVLIQNHSIHSVRLACQSLKNLLRIHPHSVDYTDDVILKDRFGAGGHNVYRFKNTSFSQISKIIIKFPTLSFILQPFANFDQGFSYAGHTRATDIRLIYLDGKLIQSYIRMAKIGDFRCNEHQGGTLTYLTLKDLPKQIVTLGEKISHSLASPQSLYSLDFILSNSGNPYLLEGNTGPGLDWNLKLKKNEFQAKKLIRLISKSLHTRIYPLIPSLETFPKLALNI